MSIVDKVRFVNERFLKKSIKCDAEWLNGCVEFFLEENPQIHNNQLYEQAQEQWELSDLCDSGIRCLPDSISKQTNCHTINGSYPLQLQYLIDISEAAYDQLQKIQEKEVDMGKEQPEFKQTQQKTKKKRVLKLELTDGHQTVTAMEYSPIPCLKTHLTPGIKIVLTGPMRCVNHVLLLEAKNVQLLAGEVSTMTIENAYENVLRRILNQPMNPNPRTDYTEQQVIVETRRNPSTIQSVPMMARSNVQSNEISSAARTTDLDPFIDDDFLCDIDIDQITSKATSQTHTAQPDRSVNQNVMTPRRSVLLFEDDIDDNDFLQIDSPVIESRPNRTAPLPPIVPDDESICDENYRFKIRGINLVTLKQLNDCASRDRLRRRHFLVKAEIDAVTDRARVSRDHKWKLGVLLIDTPTKDGKLQVRFNSDVLDKLTGVSGREINDMYAMRNTHPQVADDIEDILDRLSAKLEELNAFLKIEFQNDSDSPIVVEIINSAPVLERKLNEKLTSENLLK